jgi:hypothetical protein
MRPHKVLSSCSTLHSFQFSLLIPYRTLSFFVLFPASSFIPLCSLSRFVVVLSLSIKITLSFNHALSLIILYPAMSFSCFSLYHESSFMLLSFFRFILHPYFSFLPLYLLSCPLYRFILYPVLSFIPLYSLS